MGTFIDFPLPAIGQLCPDFALFSPLPQGRSGLSLAYLEAAGAEQKTGQTPSKNEGNNLQNHSWDWLAQEEETSNTLEWREEHGGSHIPST